MRYAALSAFCAALIASSSAGAAAFTVAAQGNSSSGGVGLPTFSVTAGSPLSVSVETNDLWSAGALPRWSNANGLTATFNNPAAYTDPSGDLVPAGNIGANFGTWTQGGLTAPFGSLVGLIGSTYQLLGTSYNGPAWSTGTLSLFYWDSNSADNSGTVIVNVNAAQAVPEPSSTGLLLIASIAFGALAWRRQP
jgi:hypothetical protein